MKKLIFFLSSFFCTMSDAECKISGRGLNGDEKLQIYRQSQILYFPLQIVILCFSLLSSPLAFCCCRLLSCHHKTSSSPSVWMAKSPSNENRKQVNSLVYFSLLLLDSISSSNQPEKMYPQQRTEKSSFIPHLLDNCWVYFRLLTLIRAPSTLLLLSLISRYHRCCFCRARQPKISPQCNFDDENLLIIENFNGFIHCTRHDGITQQQSVA